MNPLQQLSSTIIDHSILDLHSNDHKRRAYIRNNILTKELLEYLLVNQECTSNHAAHLISNVVQRKIQTSQVIALAREFGIPTLTVKQSRSNVSRKRRQEETCLVKYGSTNPLGKDTTAYHKRNETVQQKYGVANVFQSEQVKLKSVKTFQKKYGPGITSPAHIDGLRKFKRKTRIHNLVEDFLISQGIPFESEAFNRFNAYSEYLGRMYSPQVDILIDSCKLVLEINGNYWHANPSLYKPGDLICLHAGKTPAKDIWDFDLARTSQIQSFGYKVLILWEQDIKDNFETITNQILYEVNNCH